MSETGTETGLMRPVRLSYRVLYALLFACALLMMFFLLPGRLSSYSDETSQPRAPVFLMHDTDSSTDGGYFYNGTYPLTPPRSKL